METLINAELTSYQRALLTAVGPPLKTILNATVEKAPPASVPLTAKSESNADILPIVKKILIVGGVCVVVYGAYKLYEKYRDDQEFSNKAKLDAPKP